MWTLPCSVKRQDLMKRGCTTEETQDQWGFYVQHSAARGVMICHYGLHTKEDGYNAMGYNSMGVYLSRHVDVALQHCLLKPGIQFIRLILCKVRERCHYCIPVVTWTFCQWPPSLQHLQPTHTHGRGIMSALATVNEMLFGHRGWAWRQARYKSCDFGYTLGWLP